MKTVGLIVLLAAAAVNAEAQLRTQVVVAGLSQLVAFVQDPVVPAVFYAVEQSGVVRVVQNGTVLPTPFLDLRGAIAAGGEQGLLGLAFAPDVASGRVFVNFTNTAGDTVVARFRRTPENPLVVNPTSRFDLRWPGGEPWIDQPFDNHNGGHLAFGPDGFLYIGLGDGGSGNDPGNRAQDPNTLLGKMLRIDVNVNDVHPIGYVVPADNPFADGVPIGALPEIWDFGLRNPWRFSFDDPRLGGTGALFIGDVGQGAREEIDYEPAGSGGRNFGWAIIEGNLSTGLNRPRAFDPLTPPLLDYPRTFGASVTGGYVYRGTALGSAYVGRYFFADYISRRVFSVGWQPVGGGAVVVDALEHTSELAPLGPISSFAVDHGGELYLVIHSGTVLKIVSQAAIPPSAPSNLSAQTNGRTVALNWTAGAGAAQYRLEVGSRPGAANLVQFDTASAATSLTATAIPDGLYYVRVRSLNQSGSSSPSNEVVVAVGCAGPPAPPTSLTQSVSGATVTLTWSASGDLSGIVVDVGSAPGESNLASFVLPSSVRSLSGAVPGGLYYARVRAVNACGVSASSNEVAVAIP